MANLIPSAAVFEAELARMQSNNEVFLDAPLACDLALKSYSFLDFREVFQQIHIHEGREADGKGDGSTTMTIVSDFVQSFYVPVPTGFGPQDLEPFRERINRLLGNPNAVPRISMAQKPMRANGELKPLLKIYVVSPDQLHTLQDTFPPSILRGMTPLPSDTHA
ncbi:hypothetical protein CC1G_07197 [Coprinopsis cinerea okayama7|uniref:Uncharacterized protein n=1 Tax=Coprinopsis cinerea (strain Okayama-7 / 130 / ATCC MYA-4618 / FGSC 9003) TaxID=240176 RepID=A8NRF4_COPC7|nr:hypothetical protein CC1G_07197 [Coprinopsis cinerea okayama7\|eukprot:XP_001835773.1 hypothetical protein CC1G_07197 [Coprinopsis cinerea okayama7\